MSTNPVSMSSAERNPKPGISAATKQGQTAQSSASKAASPLNFAALMMQADEPETSLPTPVTAQSTGEDDKAEKDERAEPTLADSGQNALMGLLNWQSFGSGTSKNPTPSNSPSNPGVAASESENALLLASSQKKSSATTSALTGLTLATDGRAQGTPPNPLASEQQPGMFPIAGSGETPTTLDNVAQPVTNYASVVTSPALDSAAGTLSGLAHAGKKSSPLKAPHTIAALQGKPGVRQDSSAAPDVQPLVQTVKSTVELARQTIAMQGEISESSDKGMGRTPEPGRLEPDRIASPTQSANLATMGPEAQPIDLQQMPAANPQQPEGARDAQMAEVMQHIDAQISYWASQGTQNASLTIGSGQDDPIDIKVTLTDGEVKVAFLSDDEQVREALELGAQDLLQTMLDAKGISLGSVSVGSQTQQQTPQNRDSEPSPRSSSGGNVVRQNEGSKSEVLPNRRATPIISANQLDFYA